MGRSRQRRFPRIDGEELPEAMSRETGGECTSIGRSSGGWTGEARCGGGMSAVARGVDLLGRRAALDAGDGGGAAAEYWET
jgi:hypothetical protein